MVHEGLYSHPIVDLIKVVQWDDKTFTIEVNGQPKVVSLDRLKPAHVEDTSMIETIPLDDCFWSDTPPLHLPPLQ